MSLDKSVVDFLAIFSPESHVPAYMVGFGVLCAAIVLLCSYMNEAFPKKYFDKLGLVSLQNHYRKLQSVT